VAKAVRISFSRDVGGRSDAALYRLPCDPPPWRVGTKSGAGDWWRLGTGQEVTSDIYLRRFTMNTVRTTFKGGHSIEIRKTVHTAWAVVTEKEGRRFENRAEALRHALRLFGEVSRG
jgi:hypothetical protein